MTERSVPAKIDGTHDATVIACDEKLLTALAAIALPPGRPMQVALRLSDQELVLVGRCIGSKKRDAGGFTVRMRLHSLRREGREAIERAFGNPDATLNREKTTPSS